MVVTLKPRVQSGAEGVVLQAEADLDIKLIPVTRWPTSG